MPATCFEQKQLNPTNRGGRHGHHTQGCRRSATLIERFRQDMHEGWAYWAARWQRSRAAEQAAGESAQISREIGQAVEQARRDDPRAWQSILLGRDSDLNDLPPLFGPCQGIMSNDDVHVHGHRAD